MQHYSIAIHVIEHEDIQIELFACDSFTRVCIMTWDACTTTWCYNWWLLFTECGYYAILLWCIDSLSRLSDFVTCNYCWSYTFVEVLQLTVEMDSYFDWYYIFYALPAIGGFVMLWFLASCCYRRYCSKRQRVSNNHCVIRRSACPPQYRCSDLNTVVSGPFPPFNYSWRQSRCDQVGVCDNECVHGVGLSPAGHRLVSSSN